mmetsp:Transcript_29252/g.63930  ORF Transcript_29252/g.63930 Transcript_29252/m.63930 type:complete len:188 (-) Transcript_29252:278-841(-)
MRYTVLGGGAPNPPPPPAVSTPVMSSSNAPSGTQESQVPKGFPGELGMYTKLPSKFGEPNDSRADSLRHISAYLAKSNILRLLEDLTAFLVQHKPGDPWRFLSTHLQRIMPQLKEGVGAQTILMEMEVEEEPPSVLAHPGLYTEWLNNNGIFEAFQNAIQELAMKKPEDPYQAVLEFIQKQSLGVRD